MEGSTPRPEPMYPGELSDENIRRIFRCAGDFNVRQLACSAYTLYLYAIDGLTSGGDISEYVIKPVMERLRGDSMQALYNNALYASVVNSVAKACKDLDDAAMLLVNGFAVLLFPCLSLEVFG